ncbi:MAG: porin family protein [Sphingomonas sp.]|uniref:outer membrane protein n=1 Tax=Sphingomonas sp. TaxID=28214 RepID=UPI001220DA58|nr:outer membrane beta-barrel protein [Sphingomonas sp.]THD36034.1 MAG: porin family protein [Sphingomonas sp.]
MRTIVLAAASLTTLALATPAFAQDAPDKTFDGPRAGVILGYDRMQPGQVPNSNIDDSNSASGLTYGGDLGYDVQSGRWVFGAEGEVTGSTAKVTNNPSAAGALGYGRMKAGRDLYAGVRVGYAVAPRTLLYAKGGYSNQRLDLVASNGTTETGQHFNLDGWRAGAGLEQSLGGKAYAKLEYRYSNYDKARLEYPNGANTNNFSVDTDRHQIVAGLGIRF